MGKHTDMFGTPELAPSPLVGVKVKLDRPIDREKPCCRNIAVIRAGAGPHVGELRCVDCHQHRGWLSKATAAWIESVITRFGAPTTPIVVRPSSLVTDVTEQGRSQPQKQN